MDILNTVPPFDSATHRRAETYTDTLDPERNRIVREWGIVPLTPEELAAIAAASSPPVPASVTNFQARAVLLAAGLFGQVDAAIKAQPQDSPAYQAWEYANDVTRNGTLVNSMAETLGLTSVQLDELFRQAATIEA